GRATGHGGRRRGAPPQELSLRRANLFVASFIGSPAMNLIEARVERGDAGPHVCFGPHRLAVAEKAVREHPGLERFLGRTVVLGIRPEHLEDASLAHDTVPGSVIEAAVELREELGSEVDLHCDLGVAPLRPRFADGKAGETGAAAGMDGAADAGTAPAADPSDPADPAGSALAATIVARMDPRTTLQAGEQARVQEDLAALHFFDPATGTSPRS